MNFSQAQQIQEKKGPHYVKLEKSGALGIIVSGEAMSVVEATKISNETKTSLTEAEVALSHAERFRNFNAYPVASIQAMIDTANSFPQNAESVEKMKVRLEELKPKVSLAEAEYALSHVERFLNFNAYPIASIQAMIDTANSFPQNAESVEKMKVRLEELKPKAEAIRQ